MELLPITQLEQAGTQTVQRLGQEKASWQCQLANYAVLRVGEPVPCCH